MTPPPSDHPSIPSVGSYELWMVAQGAVGLIGVGGMMFLIPAYVLDEGGTPADAGAVMAVAGALALTGPYIGHVADRFAIHRLVQLLGIALCGGAALAFAFAQQTLLWLTASVLLGVGMAALSVVNATLVVGAGFDERTQARKLSLLQLSLPSGQVLGLALVAALTAADVGFRGRFVVLFVIAVVFVAIVTFVNGGAARRLHAAMSRSTDATDEVTEQPTLRAMAVSPFGITLLLIALLMVSAQAIESQYPNYMQAAFDVEPTQSASALSVIVLVSIPLYLVAGTWTARVGPRLPFLFSAAARAGAGLGLLLLPSDAGGAAIIVFAVVMIVYPMFELNGATLAALTSPIGPGPGQGAMAGAMAVGTIVASVLAGWVATEIGFSSLAAITLAAAGGALVLGLLFLRVPNVEQPRPPDFQEST